MQLRNCKPYLFTWYTSCLNSKIIPIKLEIISDSVSTILVDRSYSSSVGKAIHRSNSLFVKGYTIELNWLAMILKCAWASILLNVICSKNLESVTVVV